METLDPGSARQQGYIYTFYSYKGGVGRSMALANVGVLLARWGNRVLLVDFDIEAPGLERFFGTQAIEKRKECPGVVDLLLGLRDEADLQWQDCVFDVTPESVSSAGRLVLLTAGKDTPDYLERTQAIDWPELIDEYGAADFMFDLREQWTAPTDEGFDFVLIDSRTGITDIGGICTTLMPDALVLLFTTTEQSYRGVLEVANRARAARRGIPRELPWLNCLPLPTRDEATTEWHENRKWRRIFAQAFEPMYSPWLPAGVTAWDAMNKLHVPYVPVWSFGETLPVVVAADELAKPGTISSAYARLATLLRDRLKWVELESFITAHELEEERRVARDHLERARAETGVANQRAEEATRRWQRLRTILAAFAVVVVLLILVPGALILYKWKKGEQQKAEAEKQRQEESVASDLVGRVPNLDVVEGYAVVAEMSPEIVPERWRDILQPVWEQPLPIRLIQRPSILSATIAPRSGRLAWATNFFAAAETQNRKSLEYAAPERERIHRVEWSGAENRIVVVFESGRIGVVDLEAPGRSDQLSVGSVTNWDKASASDLIWAVTASPAAASVARDKEPGTVLLVFAPRNDVKAIRLPGQIRSVKASPDGTALYATVEIADKAPHASPPEAEPSLLEPADGIEGVDTTETTRVYRLRAVEGFKPELLAGSLLDVASWGSVFVVNDRPTIQIDDKVTKGPRFPRLTGAAFGLHGEILAWTEDFEVYRWQDGTMAPVGQPIELVATSRISSSGRLISEHGVVDLWDEGKVLLGGLNSDAFKNAISADGSIAVYCSAATGSVHVHDFTGEITEIRELGKPYALTVSPNGKFVAAGYWSRDEIERGVKLWDRATQESAWLPTDADVNWLLFARNDSVLVASTDSGHYAWDVTTRKEIAKSRNRSDDDLLNVVEIEDGKYVVQGPGFSWRFGSAFNELTGRPRSAFDATGEISLGIDRGELFRIDGDGSEERVGGGGFEILALANGLSGTGGSSGAPHLLMRAGAHFSLVSIKDGAWLELRSFENMSFVGASPDLQYVVFADADGALVWRAGQKDFRVRSVGIISAEFFQDSDLLVLNTLSGPRAFRRNEDLTEIDLYPPTEGLHLKFSSSGAELLLTRAEFPQLGCPSFPSFALKQIGTGAEVPIVVREGAARCEDAFEDSDCSAPVGWLSERDGAVDPEVLPMVLSDLRKCAASPSRGMAPGLRSENRSAPWLFDSRQVSAPSEPAREYVLGVKALFESKQPTWVEQKVPGGQILSAAGACKLIRGQGDDRLELWCARTRESARDWTGWNDAVAAFAKHAPNCLNIERQMALLGRSSEEAERRYAGCLQRKEEDLGPWLRTKAPTAGQQ